MAGVARLDEFDPRRGRTGRPWQRAKEVVYQREICWICGKPVVFGLRRNHPMGPSVDHRVPLSRGGHPTDLANLELAHFGCNSARGAGRPQATYHRPRSRNY